MNPNANQSWIFIGKTDAEAPILWPPDAKDWLIGKEPDDGEDWRQEEKGTTEDELVGWHHRLNGHELEQAPGVVMDREAWRAAVHGVATGQTRSDWTDWQGQCQEIVQESDHWLKNENHTLVSAALRVPKARRKCSCAQREKSVAFNGTTTLRADFPRTRKSEENGLASVKCWKTNNHQPGILYPTKTLFKSENKIEIFRTNGNETTYHPQTLTKKNIKAVLWEIEK